MGGIASSFQSNSPWNFAFDASYGAVITDKDELNRQGWYAMILAEYKLNWGIPGLYVWYFSGDDGDIINGSERLPYLDTMNSVPNALSSFGYRGSSTVGGGKGILGTNPTSTWGIGFRLKNMSFLEDLRHIFRLHYFGGTNSTKMADYITGRSNVNNGTLWRNNTDFNSLGTYLTTADTGIELNFDSFYKVTNHLEMGLELGYIHLMLHEDVWGRYGNSNQNSLNTKAAWKATLSFKYSF